MKEFEKVREILEDGKAHKFIELAYAVDLPEEIILNGLLSNLEGVEYDAKFVRLPKLELVAS